MPDYVWDGCTLPVPVEHIADSHYGLHVREAADLSLAPGAPQVGPRRALSGLLFPDSGQIWVNALESATWPGRRRFTISHEIGHWCLHRDDHTELIYCRSTAVDPPARVKRPRRAVLESEADAFAAAMLMPRDLVLREYEEVKSRPDRLALMCERFGASTAAMSRRLRRIEAAARQQRR